MRDVYKEYRVQHPEELKELNRLKSYTKSVELFLHRRMQREIKKVEECRRILYGDDNQ